MAIDSGAFPWSHCSGKVMEGDLSGQEGTGGDKTK